MITSNILQRVLYIRCWNQTWTAFTIDTDEKQYFITAKHFFIDPSCKVEIFKWGKWEIINLKSIAWLPNWIDIALFELEWFITPNHKILLGINWTFLAEDCYFLWFPFWKSMEGWEINLQLPLPFVKKWIVSAIYAHDNMFFIDGHNNEWFSWGPVVTMNRANNDVKVIWVMSGFISKATTWENVWIARAYTMEPIKLLLWI